MLNATVTTLLGYWCWLLGTADVGRAFTRYSRRSMSLSENWLLLVMFIAIGLLWFALSYWEKYRKRSSDNRTTPEALFQELCRAHRLSRPQRTLLTKVAHAHHLEQPALVFLDPRILDAEAIADRTDAGIAAELRKQLFG